MQTVNFAQMDLHKALNEMTGGSGPDVGIETVGMHYAKSSISKVLQAVTLNLLLHALQVQLLHCTLLCHPQVTFLFALA